MRCRLCQQHRSGFLGNPCAFLLRPHCACIPPSPSQHDSRSSPTTVPFTSVLTPRRYIVKQLSKTEKTSILECAPAYFEYLLAQGSDTCLAKILGVFQVSAPLSVTYVDTAHTTAVNWISGRRDYRHVWCPTACQMQVFMLNVLRRGRHPFLQLQSPVVQARRQGDGSWRVCQAADRGWRCA